MARKCVICGRKLRTGRKYCYDCKSGGRDSRRRRSSNFAVNSTIAVMIMFVVGGYMIKTGDWAGLIFIFIGIGLIVWVIWRGKRRRFSWQTREEE